MHLEATVLCIALKRLVHLLRYLQKGKISRKKLTLVIIAALYSKGGWKTSG